MVLLYALKSLSVSLNLFVEDSPHSLAISSSDDCAHLSCNHMDSLSSHAHLLHSRAGLSYMHVYLPKNSEIHHNANLNTKFSET